MQGGRYEVTAPVEIHGESYAVGAVVTLSARAAREHADELTALPRRRQVRPEPPVDTAPATPVAETKE